MKIKKSHAISALRRLIPKKHKPKGGSLSVAQGRPISGGYPSSQSGGVDTPSWLIEDTASLDRECRLLVQQGHRKFAKVHAREHPDHEAGVSPELEEGLSNSILEHPWLQTQRFDGDDNSVTPAPRANTAARREFDNERREQEMEKQLRLGNMPKFSNAPKPKPG